MVDRPTPKSAAVSAVLSRVHGRDTGPELAVRRLLYGHGLRYRVNYPVPGMSRRTIDVAFTRQNVAVFIDGCFWHGCPKHHVAPKNNSEWWLEKLARNRERDEETTRRLQAEGWVVLRFWEHDDPAVVVERIEAVLAAGLSRS